MNVGHAAFDLALVTRRVGFGGQDNGAVMVGEGSDLGVEVRIIVVRFDHRRFEVIDDKRPGDASEVVEGVLDSPDEVFRGLAEDDFAVRLARVAQNDAEHMRPPALAVGRDDRCSGAEVDLGFLAGLALHPSERNGACASQFANESPDRLIASLEIVISFEILPDPLGRQASIKGGLNGLFVRSAFALPPGRPGDRNGWFCLPGISRGIVGPGDRNGWF